MSPSRDFSLTHWLNPHRKSSNADFGITPDAATATAALFSRGK